MAETPADDDAGPERHRAMSALPRSDEFALRTVCCFRCGLRALRVVKIMPRSRTGARKPRYALECMVCPGHGDIKLVKRDGEPISSFVLTSWGPSDTPSPLGQEFPLR